MIKNCFKNIRSIQ